MAVIEGKSYANYLSEHFNYLQYAYYKCKYSEVHVQNLTVGVSSNFLASTSNSNQLVCFHCAQVNSMFTVERIILCVDICTYSIYNG